MGTTIDLSQEDAWDDSLLIESWNDALKEYKKYHSIASRITTAEDLEKELVAASLTATGELAKEQEEHDTMQDDYEPKNHKETTKINEQEPSQGYEVKEKIDEPPVTTTSSLLQPQIPDMAAGPLNNVKDEILKKAMMGWYYAGYYTGLYEGMQKKDNGGSL